MQFRLHLLSILREGRVVKVVYQLKITGNSFQRVFQKNILKHNYNIYRASLIIISTPFFYIKNDGKQLWSRNLATFTILHDKRKIIIKYCWHLKEYMSETVTSMAVASIGTPSFEINWEEHEKTKSTSRPIPGGLHNTNAFFIKLPPSSFGRTLFGF